MCHFASYTRWCQTTSSPAQYMRDSRQIAYGLIAGSSRVGVREASGIAGAVVRTGGWPFRRPSSQVKARGFWEMPLHVFDTCPSSDWTPHCESRFADHIEARARCILRANETSALASLDRERLTRHVVAADHRRRAHALVHLARRQRDAGGAIQAHELEVGRLERVPDAGAHRLALRQRAAEVHRHDVDAVDGDALLQHQRDERLGLGRRARSARPAASARCAGAVLRARLACRAFIAIARRRFAAVFVSAEPSMSRSMIFDE